MTIAVDDEPGRRAAMEARAYGTIRPRRTKERILNVLGMFNSFGEPERHDNHRRRMNISPGNLYHHYRSKDEIVTGSSRSSSARADELFAMGKDRSGERGRHLVLAASAVRKNLEIYRFIYRDLNDLLSKNRIIETHFKTILQNAQKNTERLMNEMRSINQLKATDGEIRAVATNLVMLATYWHSYSYVMNPRKLDEAEAMGHGVFSGHGAAGAVSAG